MKMMLSLFAALALLLSGCAVYTPGGSVVLDPVKTVNKSSDGGKFCPPGQAKKGNC